MRPPLLPLPPYVVGLHAKTRPHTHHGFAVSAAHLGPTLGCVVGGFNLIMASYPLRCKLWLPASPAPGGGCRQPSVRYGSIPFRPSPPRHIPIGRGDRRCVGYGAICMCGMRVYWPHHQACAPPALIERARAGGSGKKSIQRESRSRQLYNASNLRCTQPLTGGWHADPCRSPCAYIYR